MWIKRFQKSRNSKKVYWFLFLIAILLQNNSKLKFMRKLTFTIIMAFCLMSWVNAQNVKHTTKANAGGVKFTPQSCLGVNMVSSKKDVLVKPTSDPNPQASFYNRNNKGEVTIGTGTLTTERYPIYAYFGYSYTQSIYLKSEINEAGAITKISYYFAGTSLAVSNNWTIYLGHTTKAAFAGTTDWEPLTNLTQVYSGTFTSPTGPGWIDFDITPFVYNNTDNLVIAVDENAPGYDASADRFYNTTVTGTRSLCDYDDAINFDPAAPGTAGYCQAVIPNVKLMVGTPAADDISVETVDVAGFYLPGTVTPKATVKNRGTDPQTFDVEFKINDGTTDVYTHTQTVTAMPATTTSQLTFTPDWTAVLGTYTVTVTVTNAGDENTANDVKTKTVIVGTLSDAYAGNTTALTYGSVNLTDGTITTTGTINSTPFPMAEEYNGTAIYRIYNDFSIGTVAPDGVFTSLGTMTGVTGTPTALAYNWNTSTWYVNVLDASNLPQLCTLNMTTRVLTLVGTGTAGMIIGFDFAWDGFLYGPGLDDILYRIDPATGAVTAIGPTGVDLNYGQDVSFDGVTGKLYTYTVGATYDYGYYDLTTGAFTLITATGGSSQIATFVITKTPLAAYTVTFTVTDGTNPIPGATIVINGTTLTTNASGVVTYTYVDGTYGYVASSPGYTNGTGNVIIAGANQAVTIPLTLIPGNDAGITTIVPDGNQSTCTAGTENVVATLKNFVGTTITSVTINWTVNSVAQTPFSWTGTLGAGASVDVIIGTYNFSAANTYAIVATTSLPNGVADDDATNDAGYGTLVVTTAPTLFSENFDALTIPALPSNWLVETNVVEWQTVDDASLAANSAPNMIITYYDATSAKDDWFFTDALNLVAGTNYKLSFWYDGPGWSGVGESMKVTLGATQNAAGATQTLWDNPSIMTTSGTYEEAIVLFSPTTSGCYYLGWHAYSPLNLDYLAVDDINLEIASGVNDNVINANISVYPNPATSTIHIANAKNPVVNIYNSLGEIVMSSNKTTIDVSGLSQGLYIVKVVENNNIYTNQINILK